MNTEKQSIKKEVARKNKRKLFLKRLPRIVVGTLLGCVCIALLFNYLANLPRERYAQGYGYFERVWLGTKKIYRMTSLSLNAHHPDTKSTRLPKVEVYIKGKRLDKLNAYLPQSGDEYQKAKVKLATKEYSADVKYRGDSMNHWAFPNKSWRVRLRKGKFYDGMNTFNLNVPRVDNQLSNWLGYKMAESFPDLLTPEAKFVHFILNRRSNGVRLLLEQPGQDFLTRRNMPNGKIFIGDINSQHVYGGLERKKIYRDPSAWEIRASGIDEPSREEIIPLIDTIKNEHNPYEFHSKMESLVDMPSLLQYMALLEMVGTVHIDETHNGKYFFHPVTGKFSPVVWDTVAYFWGNEQPVDLGSNSLFRVVLSNPDFREKKDRYLWEAVTEKLPTEKIQKLIQSERERIAPDIYSFALKIHANDKGIKHISNEEWELAVAKLQKDVAERNAFIKETLQETRAVYNVVEKEGTAAPVLAIQVRSHSGITLDKIVVPFRGDVSSSAKVLLRKLGVEDIGEEIAEKAAVVTGEIVDGKIVFDTSGDNLYSKRTFQKVRNGKVVPGTYRYEIVVPSGVTLQVPDIQLVAKNSVTGKSYQPVFDATLSIPKKIRKYAVWWDPEKLSAGKKIRLSGNAELKETLRVGPRDELTIAAGTKLTLAPGASLYIDRGSIVAEGTAERPITITASSPEERWGVIAVREPKQASFAHVNLSGSSFDYLDNVRYMGAISVHGGKADVRNSQVTDGYLSVRYGELDIKDSLIRNIFPFAIQSDNAYVKEEKVKREQIKPVHHLSLLKDKAHGTPDRTEREYKWSITPKEGDPLTLEEVSEVIRASLRGSIDETPEVWKAPQFTGTQFFVDDKTADFLFRDIYCDTPDNLVYKKRASYRFRNRYSKFKDYLRLMKQPDFAEVWPYRLEFQAKTDRVELGGGYSTVEEARFEFRKASEPFSAQNPPPLAPWNLDEFLPYFQSGQYKGLTTYAAQAILEELQDVLPEGQETVEIEPRLVVLTERFRQHLNIQSPWGSGPNPEQSYIISLDKSYIYDASTYMQYLRSAALGLKPDAPTEDASVIEIEIEFERNVSDVLDRKIRAAKEAGNTEELKMLEGARAAFLADQETIMKVAQKSFAEQGIDLQPAQKSKYVQGFELLFPELAAE